MKVACKTDDSELAERGWKSFDCFGGKTCLILKDDKGLRGFVNVCPHMGGPTGLAVDEKGSKILKCQGHGAEFDIISGKRLSGPAPDGSGLRSLDIKVEDGIVYYS